MYLTLGTKTLSKTITHFKDKACADLNFQDSSKFYPLRSSNTIDPLEFYGMQKSHLCLSQNCL